MKMSATVSGLALIIVISSARAETIFQCAVNNVKQGGVRVNVIQSPKYGYRANLIFGTTVSGQMYRIQPTKEGFKGDSHGLPMELRISRVPTQNKYIVGYAAQLDVVYVDMRNASGEGSVSTTPSQRFVCGKQVRPYNE
jgi:hypothetical protein